MAVPLWRNVNSYLNVSPGAIAFWVSPPTPSIPFTSFTPRNRPRFHVVASSYYGPVVIDPKLSRAILKRERLRNSRPLFPDSHRKNSDYRHRECS